MSDFDQIATLAWQETEPPLERLHRIMLGDEWQDCEQQSFIYYKLYDGSGLVKCSDCGQTDKWTVEEIIKENGQDIPKIFVCEDRDAALRDGLPIRKLDHRTQNDIIGWEVVQDK